MHLALLGYGADLDPFNKRQKWIFVLVLLAMVPLYMYLLYVAESPGEYIHSIFVIAVRSLILISHISTIFKMETIFIFIDECEGTLNASEF